MTDSDCIIEALYCEKLEAEADGRRKVRELFEMWPVPSAADRRWRRHTYTWTKEPKEIKWVGYSLHPELN